MKAAGPVVDRLDHRALCELGVRWLKRAHSAGGHGCQVAFSEAHPGRGEAPDAIGFRAVGWLDGAVVIEAKTSRSDFLADQRKPHRANPAKGLGRWRYYLAPEGMLKAEELPAGWGLLEVGRRGNVRARSGAVAVLRVHSGGNAPWSAFPDACATWAQASDVEREAHLLVRMLARVGDPEAMNRRIREAEARAQAAERRLAALREQRSLVRGFTSPAPSEQPA